MKKDKPVILYVDDEKSNLKVVKFALDQFEVIGFERPAEALKQIGTIKPAIVLSDRKMPEMDGVEFLELVKQAYPAATRVMITGFSDEEAVINAIKRASVFGFIKKPFNRRDLEDTMLKALDKFNRKKNERVNAIKVQIPDLMEHPSWLHRITSQLEQAFKDLPQYKISHKQIEDWSLLIHLAMSAEKRYYHNTHHLFTIWDVKNPFERLAILFHDVVYVQVDKNASTSMQPRVIDLLGPLQPDSQWELKLPELVSDDVALYRVFGVDPGQTLTYLNGMNEFLSARVAQKALESVLSPWDLIRVMSCIELTIPFRARDAQGHSPAERLFQRLQSLNEQLGNPVTSEDFEQTVRSAVNVANKDLWSLAAKDAGDFLNGSWQLILEGNLPLQKELHTPKDYRCALEKMERFFGVVKPEIIFQKLDEFPPPSEYAALSDQARVNLQAGRTYFQAKILSMGILEALDELTGGNGPIEAFRGDIESETNPTTDALGKYLDLRIPIAPSAEISTVVRELLGVDPENKLRYDLKNSPLAAYVYERLKKEEFDDLVKTSTLYFSGNLQAFEFLEKFPRPLILAIIKAVSQISKTRQAELDQIRKLLELKSR